MAASSGKPILTEIEIRRLDESGIPDLQWLLKTVQNASFSQEYLSKKYDHSYLGMKPLAVMAYSGTKIIGCYCAIPQQYRSDQGTILSAHLCDFYTVPSHQGQGLNRRMANRLVDIAKAEGVQFLTIFQSEATYKTSRSRGFVSLGRMQGYLLDVGGFPLRRIIWKLTDQNRPSSKQIEKILGPYRIEPGDFQNSHAGRGGVWHDYTQKFFSYKCFTPNLHIRLNGATFWVQAGSTMLVGDVVLETETGLKTAIKELQGLCRRLGQRTIVFQVSKGTPADLALRELKTPFDSWPVEYLDLRANSETLNLGNLMMNYGDLDTF